MLICLLAAAAEAAVGERVVLEGQEDWSPISAAQVKKRKVWEQVQPLLATHPETGAALFDGVRLVCEGGAGPLLAPSIRGGAIS